MTFEEAQKKCREAVENFAEIQLVYGKAGLHFGSSLRQCSTLYSARDVEILAYLITATMYTLKDFL